MTEMKSNILVSDLKAIVGEDNVSDGIYERIGYAGRGVADLEDYEIPDVVVKPSSAQEIAEIMKYANKHKTPVVLHGSGTSLIGSSRPKHKGIVLDTTRLNWIDINEDYMYFECGAGVRCIDVINALEKRGYMLPTNPGSKIIASLGGIVACNTCGHMVDPYVGKPVDNVLGLEVVLPTGEIIETGTKSVCRPAGIDPTRVFAGSEGILGVITKIRMRLMPKPQMVYIAAFFKRVESVARSYLRMYKKKAPLPLYGEFVGTTLARMGFEHKGLKPPEGPITLVNSTGRTSEEAMQNAGIMCEIFRKEKPIDICIFKEAGGIQEKIWHIRDWILFYLQKKQARSLGVEVTVALPHLVEAMLELHIMHETSPIFKDAEVLTYGHIGSLSMHRTFPIPTSWPNDKRREAAMEIARMEREMHLKYEGCGKEWGQLGTRTRFFKMKYGEATYSMVMKLKKALDPNNVLNPGVLQGGNL